MSIFEQKAQQIAQGASDKEEVSQVALDPFTIGVIVQILIQAVKLYMECRKNSQETAEAMRSPGVLDRWRLRRLVRENLDHDEAHDLLAGPLFRSTLRVASDVTDEDVGQMYAEVASM